ncbi:MAG TPA: phosphoglycerate dehydrogenase [Candidatus Acidoferrales bacterium]|nr:phosphoglycerate dehydrogenase [Candidatus Acidoferrales bacterium]
MGAVANADLAKLGTRRSLPVVHVADPLAEDGLVLLRDRCDVRVTQGLKEADLGPLLADVDALIVRSETKVTASLMDRAPRLAVVGRAGVGVDNIDVPAATERGVYVVNAPLGNIVAAAEHAIALALALLRKIPEADRSVRAGEWTRSKLMGRELRGKTLGLIGIGRVGSEVARRCAAFEMKVIAFDPFASEAGARAAGAQLVELDELFARADVISLHTPLTDQTRGMINATTLAKMKPTTILVNASRGEVVDPQDLADALAKGTIAGAALDVFPTEPLAADSPLRGAPRTVLTPHIAGSTSEAQVNVAVDVVKQVLDILDGKPARFAVNAPRPPADEAGGSAWVRLAERLGSLAAQLLDERPGGIELHYAGALLEIDPEPLRAAVVKGLLETFSEQRVNLVNALAIARARGLDISERRETEAPRYRALLQVRVGKTEVGGTLVQGEPRIVSIDGFWVDVPVDGHLLLTKHQDKPGLVGRVGTLLGEHDVNISSMQVGRASPRGEALMILTLDDPVPDDVRARIGAFSDVDRVRTAKLG